MLRLSAWVAASGRLRAPERDEGGEKQGEEIRRRGCSWSLRERDVHSPHTAQSLEYLPSHSPSLSHTHTPFHIHGTVVNRGWSFTGSSDNKQQTLTFSSVTFCSKHTKPRRKYTLCDGSMWEGTGCVHYAMHRKGTQKLTRLFYFHDCVNECLPQNWGVSPKFHPEPGAKISHKRAVTAQSAVWSEVFTCTSSQCLSVYHLQPLSSQPCSQGDYRTSELPDILTDSHMLVCCVAVPCPGLFQGTSTAVMLLTLPGRVSAEWYELKYAGKKYTFCPLTQLMVPSGSRELRRTWLWQKNSTWRSFFSLWEKPLWM